MSVYPNNRRGLQHPPFDELSDDGQTAPGCNTLILSACLTERGVMRYTPAGVPVMEGRLVHRSEQLEAGIGRQIGFEVGAVAMGDVAHAFAQIQPGSRLTVTGFLAPLRRSSRILRVHLTRIDLN